MFFSGVFLFIVLLIVGVITRRAGKSQGSDAEMYQSISKLSFVGAPAALLIFTILSAFAVIQPGQVGVQVVFGKVQNRTFTDGLQLKNPLAKVVRYSTRAHEFTMTPFGEKPEAIKIITSDNLEIVMDLTALMRIEPFGAQFLLRTLGKEDVVHSVLSYPNIRSSSRAVGTGYPAMKFLSGNRDKVAKEIQDEINQTIIAYCAQRGYNGPPPLVCEAVMLRNILPPDSIKNAIEAKLSADQEQQAMEFVIKKAEKEATRKTIEAKGISDAQKIIQRELTTEYLQWKYIEALERLVNSPNNTILVLPFDQKLTPMINVNGTHSPAVAK